MVRKVTFRLDDEVTDSLATFCAEHGITMTAMVSSTIRTTMVRYHQRGGGHVSAWPESPSRVTFMEILVFAREVDAQRRQRR